ncbi:MAG TPA: hypothetical protein HPP91_14820, partial [Gammaproteobacteria bacterium]|nr:hypothetical protein [Gammaproteobacteria bacterium]
MIKTVKRGATATLLIGAAALFATTANAFNFGDMRGPMKGDNWGGMPNGPSSMNWGGPSSMGMPNNWNMGNGRNGNTPWSGGNTPWSGGNTPWSGGNT